MVEKVRVDLFISGELKFVANRVFLWNTSTSEMFQKHYMHCQFIQMGEFWVKLLCFLLGNTRTTAIEKDSRFVRAHHKISPK